MTHCPACSGEIYKVIYFGLPGRLCADEFCGTFTGLASLIPPIAFDDRGAAYMVYEGSYWKALLEYMKG